MFNIKNNGELLNCYCSSKKMPHWLGDAKIRKDRLTLAFLGYAASEMGRIIYPHLVLAITPNFFSLTYDKRKTSHEIIFNSCSSHRQAQHVEGSYNFILSVQDRKKANTLCR